MIIRDEKKSDIEAISEITIAAFKNCPHGNHTEQFIISALRAANALAVSLVAEIEGRVVGHIAFSPVTISGRSCDWYGLVAAIGMVLVQSLYGRTTRNRVLENLWSMKVYAC